MKSAVEQLDANPPFEEGTRVQSKPKHWRRNNYDLGWCFTSWKDSSYYNLDQDELAKVGGITGRLFGTILQGFYACRLHFSAIQYGSMEWFSERDIKVMELPARSPDLNSIENLWRILEQYVYSNEKQYGTARKL